MARLELVGVIVLFGRSIGGDPPSGQIIPNAPATLRFMGTLCCKRCQQRSLLNDHNKDPMTLFAKSRGSPSVLAKFPTLPLSPCHLIIPWFNCQKTLFSPPELVCGERSGKKRLRWAPSSSIYIFICVCNPSEMRWTGEPNTDSHQKDSECRAGSPNGTGCHARGPEHLVGETEMGIMGWACMVAMAPGSSVLTNGSSRMNPVALKITNQTLWNTEPSGGRSTVNLHYTAGSNWAVLLEERGLGKTARRLGSLPGYFSFRAFHEAL